MKKAITTKTLGVLNSSILFTIGCGNNSNKQKVDTETIKLEVPKEAEISGEYSGRNKFKLPATFSLNSSGNLKYKAKGLNDGNPSYGRWTGTAKLITIYIDKDAGGELYIGDAKITEDGLQIIGGKFFSRQ